MSSFNKDGEDTAKYQDADAFDCKSEEESNPGI